MNNYSSVNLTDQPYWLYVRHQAQVLTKLYKSELSSHQKERAVMDL